MTLPEMTMADARSFRESYHKYRHVICDACGEEIDLSEDETIDAAIDTWNEHVEGEHQ